MRKGDSAVKPHRALLVNLPGHRVRADLKMLSAHMKYQAGLHCETTGQLGFDFMDNQPRTHLLRSFLLITCQTDRNDLLVGPGGGGLSKNTGFCHFAILRAIFVSVSVRQAYLINGLNSPVMSKLECA